MRLLLVGWTVAAALAATAHAEGGLPGSPQAVPERPPSAVAPLEDAPARAAPASEAGGALFSPFASAQRAPVAEPPPPIARDGESGPLDSTLTIVAAAVGGLATVAALWIFQRTLQG